MTTDLIQQSIRHAIEMYQGEILALEDRIETARWDIQAAAEHEDWILIDEAAVRLSMLLEQRHAIESRIARLGG